LEKWKFQEHPRAVHSLCPTGEHQTTDHQNFLDAAVQVKELMAGGIYLLVSPHDEQEGSSLNLYPAHSSCLIGGKTWC
jgi:hypothetical protein